MRKTKLFIAFLAICVSVTILLTGCGTNENQNENKNVSIELIEGYKEVESIGVKVQYKEDWTFEETEISGYASLAFLSPAGTSQIAISKETLPMTMSLEQYKNASVTNIEEMYGDDTQDFEVQEEKFNTGIYDAYRIKYSIPVQGFEQQITQTVIVKDKAAYIITFSTAEEGTEEVYHNIEKTLQIL